MVDPGDMWPEPHYNAGGRKHLHALGVIAVTYRAFQRNMDDIYKFYLRKQKVPDALMNAYYFSLDEGNRVSVLKGVCKEYETDPKIFALVENLAEYFYWCKNCRDELVHAEQYPALFGGASDTITLTKRIGKTDPKTGYVALCKRRSNNPSLKRPVSRSRRSKNPSVDSLFALSWQRAGDEGRGRLFEGSACGSY